MEYRNIEGYKHPYRISEEGTVEKKLKTGRWVVIQPNVCRNVLRTKLIRPDGSRHNVMIKSLMRDHFMGGKRPGMCVICRNKMQTDCALENLMFVPRYSRFTSGANANRKPVVKIDEHGKIIEAYSSIREAARKNFISESCVSLRCKNKVKNPFSKAYFTFKFAR